MPISRKRFSKKRVKNQSKKILENTKEKVENDPVFLVDLEKMKIVLFVFNL